MVFYSSAWIKCSSVVVELFRQINIPQFPHNQKDKLHSVENTILHSICYGVMSDGPVLVCIFYASNGCSETTEGTWRENERDCARKIRKEEIMVKGGDSRYSRTRERIRIGDCSLGSLDVRRRLPMIYDASRLTVSATIRNLPTDVWQTPDDPQSYANGFRSAFTCSAEQTKKKTATKSRAAWCWAELWKIDVLHELSRQNSGKKNAVELQIKNIEHPCQHANKQKIGSFFRNKAWHLHLLPR